MLFKNLKYGNSTPANPLFDESFIKYVSENEKLNAKITGMDIIDMKMPNYMNKSIYDFNWEFPVCVVLGNEVKGISEELLHMSDYSVEIPMQGIKQSLNVSVAAGVVGYQILNYYKNKI